MASRASALVCLVLLAGCGSSSSTRSSSAPPRGKVFVVYDAPAGQAAANARKALQLGGTNGVADGFTKSFKLPRDIRIHAVNGFVGPNYNPGDHTITLSYGFVNYVERLLETNFPQLVRNQNELGREWAAIDGFILVHEWAHALIDIYNFPVLGKEEDAADALATVFMTQFVNGGDEFAFDAAKFFDALSARQRHLSPSDYWDAHSLDKQRAYSILCWIAGSTQTDYKVIVNLHVIGGDRLQTCPAEYRQRVRSWLELLKPHLSNG